MSYLVIDTETSGLMDYKRPADAPGQPRVIEFAGVLLDDDARVQDTFHRFIRPPSSEDGYEWMVTPEVTAIHGLTHEFLCDNGVPIKEVLEWYSTNILADRSIVAFGAQFDCKMMRAELRRAGMDDLFERTRNICLMRSARPFAKTIGRELVKAGGNNKGWPKLSDLCAFLGIEPQEQAHSAINDALVTALCFAKMLGLGFDATPEVHHAKNYEEIRNAK